MGLSRLDNFLKSVRGTILYVNPNDLDATDSIENQGNSLTRPFKTIQRALVEAARFSYQRGLNNDRFGKTTILLYPGEHIVDNRPGFIPDGLNNFRLRNGTTTNDLPPYDLTSNFDLSSADNELYKLNSIRGGVILPRGTSIVGLDLRKTKVIPKYVPDPTNDNIERSAIFRVTGACYLWQFSLFDADPNGTCFIDYTSNQFVPNFSHHKLSCFEYADGTNNVSIDDAFLTYATNRTDLDMYYEKIGLVYGQSSGRAIEPDYPSSGLDIQAKIDEYRIVGSTGQSVGITSIRAGDGVTSSTTITVTTDSAVAGLDVDTPFRIEGITASGYNGQFVVSDKPSSTQIQYSVQNAPANALPSVTGATISLQSDTVTSASPYIFNISMRSVFGMCGLLADGDKADGFKSVVVAQFTGIGLQKDDKAFVKYNPTSGTYEDNTVAGNEKLSTDSLAVFKPAYRNFHIKSTNNSFIQCVSIFAIGYAEHFVAENGGDMSITNSNSNFGARALIASGFRNEAFRQDDQGYITHIIPPKQIPLTETALEFEAIDVNQTGSAVGVGSTGHLYLYNRTNSDIAPENVIEGYRIGARNNDILSVLVSSGGSVTEYKSRITMDGYRSTDGVVLTQNSYQKVFNVKRSVAGINSIGSFSDGGAANVITLTTPHSLREGESIRVISDTGQLPDGIEPNNVYYAITSGLSTNVNIKVAKTLSDALDGTEITINEKGGALKVVSRVSDKNSGDLGHPIQYDDTNGQWYINVSTASTENTIYSTIVGLGSTGLGEATSRTFVKRKSDSRGVNDTLYRVRYVIPKDAGGIVARVPQDGFILQESNTSIGSTNSEIQTYFGTGSISNVNQQRNFRFIADAIWDGSNANFTTEIPHNLSVGSQVEIVNVTSANNATGTAGTGFNRTYTVAGISSSKRFSVGLSTDPGAFTNDTSTRTISLPYYKRKRYENTYYTYRNQEHQRYISGEQDGIYYLTLLNSSNSPSVAPFIGENYSQPVKQLFPQINKDEPVSDPKEATCFADSELIGYVQVDDVQNSITKETINKFVSDSDIGVGITNIVSQSGVAHTIYTSIDHGFNRITSVSIVSGGTGYGSGSAGDLYNAKLVSIGSSTTGKHASAKLTVDGSGTITDVTIMDGGSAFGIGNTLNVVGVATTTGFSQAVLQVDSIYDNVGDVVRITGVSSESYSQYNQLYRITQVSAGSDKEFNVSSASSVAGFSTTGLGATLTSSAHTYLTGEAIGISALTYNKDAGIATVTTNNRHGLKVDNLVRFTGANQDVYNGDFVVTENISLTSFSVNIGVGTTAPTATGTQFALLEGITSRDGIITENNENLNGRMIPTYAGITTTLSAQVINVTTDELNITNPSTTDIIIGDYLMVDDEIMRVKTTTTGSNPLKVFRGVLGSKPATHSINSVVRRIKVEPIEFRRHSINRASAHTFEYVGFGPGNYSTALPQVQNRIVDADQELLAQSTRRDAGINFYTGMNDRGISYSGNKKLSSITGREEIFDTPIKTVVGEDITNLPQLNVVDANEGVFSRSIKVDGGTDGKAASEFNGPLIVNNKITSTSPSGIEGNSFFIQGDTTVSRKYTVGLGTPSLAGNPGDVVYNANPSSGGYIGWVYTLQNNWRRFGNVSLSANENNAVFDNVGIATTSSGDCKLKVGSGTSVFCVDGTGVGIGTTANTYKLQVLGNSNFLGIVTATQFIGDGSGLTNLQNDSLWSGVAAGLGTGIYANDLVRVGIGTSIPDYDLEVGSTGSGTTSMYVNGVAKFVGVVTTNDAHVAGIITAKGFDLTDSSSGRITAGIVTTTTLNVGTAQTVLTTSGVNVGVGTASPRAKFDVDGHARFRTYSENVGILSIVSNVVTVDLSTAQSFICTATANISQFTLINAPSGSTEFTIRIAQDGTGSRSVGIDTFKTSGGVDIPVFWPGGGVLPIVTPTASRSDIYTFKTFDGDNLTTSGLYGVVVGQNFAN